MSLLDFKLDNPPVFAHLKDTPDGTPVVRRDIQVAVTTDITLDGQYGEEWLVITTDALLVYASRDSYVPRIQLLLSSLSRAWVESMVGNHALMCTFGNKTIELVRFSYGQYQKFSRIAHFLQQTIEYFSSDVKGDRPSVVENTHEDKQRCPNCGFPFPEASRVCPFCIKKRKVLARIIRYLSPYWKEMVIIWILMFTGLGLSLIPPYLIRPLMDKVLVPPTSVPINDRLRLLGLLVLGLFVSQLINHVVNILRSRTVVRLGTHLSHDLRLDLYSHLQWVSLRFFQKRSVGALISRIMHDTQSLENVIADGIQHFVVNVLTLIGIGVVMFSINWKLTVLTLIPVPIVIVVSRFLWRYLRSLWHRYMHYRARLSASVNDVLSGIRVVKAFGKEEDEIIRFRGDSKELQVSDQSAEQTWATWFPCLWFITSTGSLLVWYFGGQQVVAQRVTLGTLMTFQSYLAMFYGPLQFLSRIADYLARSLTSAERVFEILDSERDVQPEGDMVALPSMRGRVELKNVTFSYEAGRPALKNINFVVNEGEMIGLVGHTGAGKTTTVNLICGFYEPQQGDVLIDGIKVRKIRRDDLRRQLGVVLQDTFLFNGTIAENISYAKPDADELEIMRAAKAANAHDFIVQKTDGYDTKVGERGQSLSAGERQRIAIARAILHNPKILILDEATASVDVETEQHIQEAVNRLVEGRTTLAIAHRIGTLSHANRLLVFKEGEIIEAGTPSELIARQGEFCRLLNIATGKMRGVEEMFTPLNKAVSNQHPSTSDTTSLRILQPSKVHFLRDGGLFRMTLENELSVSNVVVLRAFPLSRASRYFSIREHSGNEIGILSGLDGLSSEDKQILLRELSKRYFVPKILQILSTNERFGVVEWTVETDRGFHKFTTRELRENVLRLGRGRYVLIDVDENRYEIPDTSQLDPSSYSRLIRHI